MELSEMAPNLVQIYLLQLGGSWVKITPTGCGNDLPILLRDHYFRICGPISSYSGTGHLRLAVHLLENVTMQKEATHGSK